MAEATEANKTPPPTPRDVFDAIARVREQQEQAIATQAIAKCRSAVEVTAKNVELWRRVWASEPWAVVPAAMTPRQRWLVGEFESQADDALSRGMVALQAGRVTEAARCHEEYCELFNESARIKNEIFTRLRVGQPTQRVGESVVPPGLIERVAFRDAQGRLARVIERSNGDATT
jgi:predicted transcriptional regulator